MGKFFVAGFFVAPDGILHGYGERSALLEESDVGLDQIVDVSVQLWSRSKGRQEVLQVVLIQCILEPGYYLQQRT